MPRYLIERHFPSGLGLMSDQKGREAAATVINGRGSGDWWERSGSRCGSNRCPAASFRTHVAALNH